MSFNPSCIARFPPEPMMGLPVAKSGVCDPSPNELPFEGSSPLWERSQSRAKRVRRRLPREAELST